MLVRLFGKNFRSLRDRFELSMVAADLKRDDDRGRGTIEVAITGMEEPLQLLRVAAIYGPNASGKSTLLTAGRALRWIVKSSSHQAKPGSAIPPYEPFKLDASAQDAPIELGCDVVHGKKVLRYEISYTQHEIQTERLSLLSDSGSQVLIDRQQLGAIAGTLITKSKANQLYVKGMQPNVAVLSKLAQHGPQKGKDSAQPYFRSINIATQYADYSDAAESSSFFGDERFATDDEYREWIMQHLMRTADVGICGVQTRQEAFSIPDTAKEQLTKLGGEFQIPESRVLIEFVHKGNSNQPIDFAHESSGTKKLFNIAGDWWKLSKEHCTLFADELSASLHPRLLDRLVRAVNSPALSNIRSQLIFTTHDIGLLEGQDGEPPALRRDQVFFTSKATDGASELYSLAEFKEDARPVHNIRKRYMSGIYGAIPSVERLSL